MLDDLIDNTRSRKKEDGNHAAQDHHGNKVRRIGDHLDKLAESLSRQIVQQQRENNRDRNAYQKRVDAQRQRIFQECREFIAAEEALEMGKMVPLATPYPKLSDVVLEGDLNAVHRNIMKNDIIYNDRQDHQIQNPVFADVLAQPSSILLLS